jgi:hypothetical protein
MTRQVLVHHTAGCHTCSALVSARNVQAWAHNHVRHHPGHVVELAMGYRVSDEGRAATKERRHDTSPE